MVAGQPMVVKEPNPTNLPTSLSGGGVGDGGRSASQRREAEAVDAVLSTRHLEMDGTTMKIRVRVRVRLGLGFMFGTPSSLYPRHLAVDGTIGLGLG